MSFVDNDRLCFSVTEESSNSGRNNRRGEIIIASIRREERGRVAITDPERIFPHDDSSFIGVGTGKLASTLSSRDKKLTAYTFFPSADAIRVMLLDLKGLTPVSRTFEYPLEQFTGCPSDLAFSPDGSMLAVTDMNFLNLQNPIMGRRNHPRLYIIDCTTDRAEDIGEPRAIQVDELGPGAFDQCSFTPDSSKILALYEPVWEPRATRLRKRLVAIDVDSGRVLFDDWNNDLDSSWASLVA